MFVALLGVLASAPATAAASTLSASVGPGFTISMNAPTAPGTYTVSVTDGSADHNFHLTGPGVGQSTGIAFVGHVSWTVTLQAGATYTYVCDPHQGAMRGSFTVPAASTTTGSGATPGGGGSGGSGSATGGSHTHGSHAGATHHAAHAAHPARASTTMLVATHTSAPMVHEPSAGETLPVTGTGELVRITMLAAAFVLTGLLLTLAPGFHRSTSEAPDRHE